MVYSQLALLVDEKKFCFENVQEGGPKMDPSGSGAACCCGV